MREDLSPNRLLIQRIAITAIMALAIAYAMSADLTAASPDELVPPPSSEEIAAQRRVAFWMLWTIVWVLASAGVTAWLAWAVWRKGNEANDITLKRYEAAIASAIKTSRQLEKDNLTLRGKVATLETNASTSAKEVAKLQKDASDAKAAQQRVEIELAKQQEETAKAKLELLTLRQSLSARFFNEEDLFKFADALAAGPKGDIEVMFLMGDAETMFFTQQIVSALAKAGWTLNPRPHPVLADDVAFGVVIFVHDTTKAPARAATLQNAFTALSVATEARSSSMLPEDKLVLTVAPKFAPILLWEQPK